ncbi:uncharacterized protein PV09_08403 [Verruconis gallopava]|uniref:Uncharacterized protein n=1 Tax=Verruconis gallopava TaxID=253628 RepID=A0A0D2ALS6_9PEZI|nr:uncharacterized protein PV09_08403 [Verruconis gallopava]KIW00059.1 hypothetical protein PV09_08403 [Verruconis gallopava]
MDRPPAKRQIPATFGKYFKTTQKAQRLMDPERRLCELDRGSNDRELVFSTHPAYGEGWNEMTWSQALLWETAQNDPTLRVARKSLESVKPGAELNILETDMFNSLGSFRGVAPQRLATVRLGYAQCRRNYVYLLSRFWSADPVSERVRQTECEDEGSNKAAGEMRAEDDKQHGS